MIGKLSVSPKWLSLLGACLCTTPAGVVYAFSLYGPQLALRLGYTSVQINFIAAAGNLGVYVTTPFFGYFADTRPAMSLSWVSACLFLIGFYAIALTYEGTLMYTHYLVVAFYYFIVGMACACSNIVALSTTGHNFKGERGIGIGIPVTMFGLSASIFSCFYRIFFVHQEVPDIPGFLKFLAFTTFLWTFWGSFLLVKINGNHKGYADIPLDEISDGTLDEPIEVEQKKSYVEYLELGGKELFFNFDARLLFFIISFIGGSGLMFINNIGSVLRALHEVGEVKQLSALQSYCVTILSIFNCIGRLLFALTSDKAALSKWRVRRSSYLLASALLAFLAHLALAFSSSSFIVLCAAAQGLGYGMMYAVSTTITSMWFGTKNYGTNWGWMSAGPGICGQVMSFVFGSLYDSEVINRKPGGKHVCTSGIKCYSLAFQIAAILCLMAIIITYALRARRVKLHQ